MLAGLWRTGAELTRSRINERYVRAICARLFDVIDDLADRYPVGRSRAS
jgi:hypothetical protein